MTSHSADIGSEPTEARRTPADFVALMELELGQGAANDFAVLAAINARDPHLVWSTILAVAHARGRHADGRCPELCPRF